MKNVTAALAAALPNLTVTEVKVEEEAMGVPDYTLVVLPKGWFAEVFQAKDCLEVNLCKTGPENEEDLPHLHEGAVRAYDCKQVTPSKHASPEALATTLSSFADLLNRGLFDR